MSRMLAYSSLRPMAAAIALGDDLLARFAELARVHADGWGTAWVDESSGDVRVAGGPEAPTGADRLRELLAPPSRIRMVYLRFASRGAPPAPWNTQPFLRDGFALQHNGLIAPRADLLSLLPDDERSRLRGSTDSEAYFAVLRAYAGGSSAPWDASAVARSVALVRSTFRAACLNAMLLTPSGLTVVHAPGSARAPLAAFAKRNLDLAALPPGHDDDYNMMRMTTTEAGARVVATTGIDSGDWTALPVESVLLVTPEGFCGTRVGHDKASSA